MNVTEDPKVTGIDQNIQNTNITRPVRKTLNWRKWFYKIHRDLGYLFFGATIVYASSGLFLNHRNQWKLTYETVSRHKLVVPAPSRDKVFTRQDATNLLALAGVNGDYLSHNVTSSGVVRIIFQEGSAEVDQDSGRTVVETLRHRPLPFLLTYIRLHFNPGPWCTWFSDGYCAALILMAISVPFLLADNQGLASRGGALLLLGIAVPMILVLFHL